MSRVPYEVWQLDDSNEDTVRMRFMNYEWNVNHGNVPTRDLYRKVWESKIVPSSLNRMRTLDAIFALLNSPTFLNEAKHFTGHSMSVSDVVVLDGKAYYCDSIGFKMLENW